MKDETETKTVMGVDIGEYRIEVGQGWADSRLFYKGEELPGVQMVNLNLRVGAIPELTVKTLVVNDVSE